MFATKGRGAALIVLSTICLVAGISLGLAIYLVAHNSDSVGLLDMVSASSVSGYMATVFSILIGLPLVIPSIIGIIAGAKRNFGLHVAHLVLVIISLIWVFIVAVLMIVAALGVSAAREQLREQHQLSININSHGMNYEHGSVSDQSFGDAFKRLQNNIHHSMNNDDSAQSGLEQFSEEAADDIMSTMQVLFMASGAVGIIAWVLELAASIICCVSLCTARPSGPGGAAMVVTTSISNGYNQPVAGVISPLPQYEPAGEYPNKV